MSLVRTVHKTSAWSPFSTSHQFSSLSVTVGYPTAAVSLWDNIVPYNMEPISALAVAGNVLQFVDFSHKLITKILELYKAADGTSDNNKHLEAVLRDSLLLNLRIVADAKEEKDSTLLRVIRGYEADVDGVDLTIKSLCGHSLFLSRSVGGDTESERQIFLIANSCNDIANHILARLEKLKIGGKGGVWKSLKIALASSFGAEAEIMQLQVKLNYYRTELQWHILVSLR